MPRQGAAASARFEGAPVPSTDLLCRTDRPEVDAPLQNFTRPVAFANAILAGRMTVSYKETSPMALIEVAADGTVKTPKNPTIPFIEGDGTGRDIWRASVRVF